MYKRKYLNDKSQLIRIPVSFLNNFVKVVIGEFPNTSSKFSIEW